MSTLPAHRTSAPEPAFVSGASEALAAAVDFDVHGAVGVRLLSPSSSDVETARRALGTPPGALEREPDLRVGFVSRLPRSGAAWIEPDGRGFDAEGYLVFRSGRRPGAARVSFDDEGTVELLCERGRYLPLLLPLVRLAALRGGAVAVHASAFEVDGSGVLAAGWAHGGKTSALLAFMERGARYVADDWVLLDGDGARMSSLPGAVTLSDRQLARSPLVRSRIGASTYLARSALGWAGRALPRAVPGAADSGFGRVAVKLGSALTRRAESSFEPEVLFGERRAEAARPRVLFLMVRHEAANVRVEPLEPATAARRVANASRYEDLPLLGHYLGYRFAFPDGDGVSLVEEAPARRERLLVRALAGVRAYEVRHPRAVDLGTLHDAMAPCLEGAS